MINDYNFALLLHLFIFFLLLNVIATLHQPHRYICPDHYTDVHATEFEIFKDNEGTILIGSQLSSLLLLHLYFFDIFGH